MYLQCLHYLCFIIPEEVSLITFEDITYPPLPPQINSPEIASPEQSLSFGFETSLIPSVPPSVSLIPSAPLCTETEVEGFTIVNSPSAHVLSLVSNNSFQSVTLDDDDEGMPTMILLRDILFTTYFV